MAQGAEEDNGLSIYIHVPFCEKKCPYCDFNSFETTSVDEPEYVEAVSKELSLLLKKYSNYNFPKKLYTLYFGGGTPSTLSPKALESIIKSVGRSFKITKDTEITIEANPGSSDILKFKDYLGIGINRLSLGIQSFHDEELKTLGRIHNGFEAKKAIEAAIESGFENISLDLIFALPNQTTNNFMNNLDTALSFDVQHISLYGLTYEEGTAFYTDLKSGVLEELNDETYIDMYALAVSKLKAYGFDRYEISNFAREGFISKHNNNYWQRKDYLSLGPGAHSFLKDLGPAPGSGPYGTRWRNVKNYEKYLSLINSGDLSSMEFIEVLSQDDAFKEAVMLGLRTTKGIEVDKIEAQFGHDLAHQIEKASHELIKSDFLTKEDRTLKLTHKGFKLNDSIINKLLS